jgi:hypothetical protein
MTFNPTDFSGWCEQDVREGIIAKLLEELEYEKGSKNDVLRGEQLSSSMTKRFSEDPRKRIGRWRVFQTTFSSWMKRGDG